MFVAGNVCLIIFNSYNYNWFVIFEEPPRDEHVQWQRERRSSFSVATMGMSRGYLATVQPSSRQGLLLSSQGIVSIKNEMLLSFKLSSALGN